MQVKRNNSSKKKILIIIVAVLVVLGGTAVFAYVHMKNPVDQDKSTKQTEQTNSDKQQAAALQSNPDSKDKSSNSDKPEAPATDDASGKKQVQMTASTDTSNGTIFIRGGVNYPVTGGSCYALLSGPASQSIRKNTTLLQGPASTDCKTIAIATSDLAPGVWTFTLHYTSSDYEGVSDEVSFTI